jgi:sRNA-binding protein
MRKSARQAARVLARETGFPLFTTIAETLVAIPMPVGVDEMVAAAAAERGGDVAARRARRALYQLAISTCYLTALSIKGARRHDVNGKPVGPVSAEHQARARAQLEPRRQGPTP